MSFNFSGNTTCHLFSETTSRNFMWKILTVSPWHVLLIHTVSSRASPTPLLSSAIIRLAYKKRQQHWGALVFTIPTKSEPYLFPCGTHPLLSCGIRHHWSVRTVNENFKITLWGSEGMGSWTCATWVLLVHPLCWLRQWHDQPERIIRISYPQCRFQD